MNNIEKTFIKIDDAMEAMIAKMTNDERRELLPILVNQDWDKLSGVCERFGFKILTPPEEQLSDDSAEFMAKMMAKGFDVNAMFSELGGLIGTDRKSNIPLDDYELIVKEVRRLDSFMYSDKNTDNVMSSYMGKDVLTVLKAFLVADIAGCDNLKQDLLKLHAKLHSAEYLRKANDLHNKNKIISEDRSKARKGKTNRHNTEALNIAKDTWDIYPNASVAGMAEEIYFHLRKSWTNNDLPKISTIEVWLTKSGLIPDIEPKNRNRDFKLVIKGE